MVSNAAVVDASGNFRSVTPDTALKKICRELDGSLSGFSRTGHRWVRVLQTGITHSIDLRPMSSFRGLGVKALRLQVSIGLTSDTPEAMRSVRTISEHGLADGRDVVWWLPRDCDDALVEQTVASLRLRLPEILTYLTTITDAESFLARRPATGVHNLRDFIALNRPDRVRIWLDQACPSVDQVRDAPAGWSQLRFADSVFDAHACIALPLESRWRHYIEAVLNEVRGLTWPTVTPWTERVSQRLAATADDQPVEPDPRPRPVIKLRR